MNSTTLTRHLRNSLIIAVSLSLSAISCARIGRLSGIRTQTDKARLLYCKVPVGLRGSESLTSSTFAGEFSILLPNSGEILMYSPNADPIDLNRLDGLVKSFVDNKKIGQHIVYITSAYDVAPSLLTSVIDVLRKNEIETVRFMTSDREVPENEDCEQGWRDLPLPDGYLEVELLDRNELPQDKPNPLTLFVTSNLGIPSLNNEASNENEALIKRLVQIFRQREDNGVFREHTNEVEKTVHVEIEDQNEEYAKKTQKYGDVIRLIDALKLAGTSPIVLGDPRNARDRIDLDVATVEVQNDPALPVKTTEGKVPKVISGGVLNGKATNLPKPPYPPAAKAVRASGAVSVQVTVDENGSVIEAKAVSGHPLLKAAAEQAARSARFAPTLLSGQRVKVTGVITYNFYPE